jgi:hypothetical protein
MKKLLLLSIVICLFFVHKADAQLGGIMKSVKNAITEDVLGDKPKEKDKPDPEPACACDQAELILDLGGNLNFDYAEIGISQQDDGSLLVTNQQGDGYYIVKDGNSEGPYKSGDPQLSKFGVSDDGENSIDGFILKNKDYISRSGDKLLITFMGKKYGPFAQINTFIVTKSKDKFAAMVVEDVAISEADGKKMEEAMKNAKTDEEKMAISMQINQQMLTKMMNNGKPLDMTPKFVSNIPDATYDLMQAFGGQLNGTLKYDDILVVSPDKISDLKGNTIMTLIGDACNPSEMFVNTSNTRYACFSYGTLTFSDKTTMSELFSPHLLKTDGKVYLAYMYYSPKRNSIMQCKIPF